MTGEMSEEDALAHINSIKDHDSKVSYPGVKNRDWSNR